MPAEFSVWEAEKVQRFLDRQKEFVLDKMSSTLVRQAIELTFDILEMELKYESEIADREFSSVHNG